MREIPLVGNHDASGLQIAVLGVGRSWRYEKDDEFLSTSWRGPINFDLPASTLEQT
jgi:hypothetical protein